MQDPTTIALNLTFFGTLGVAFAMFIGLFAVFVLTLVIAGVGRLVATIAFAVAQGLSRAAGAAAAVVRPTPPAPAARAAAPATAPAKTEAAPGRKAG
ncbi:putative lipid-binding transport protein (Tim44 family) [Arthrobacter sp. B3I9]|uniref:hypothetical protein n=1 Tax=Arthrobacter sp. B3I9 TaxID=3042270 RepID=UPI00278E2328|nr:hypothetical protein [Arthrobacter sp. B3I9]MDQ0848524.1 putative lipid-binding transport protein (Tim44 family) [Arthrobacter sp. B3I9]